MFHKTIQFFSDCWSELKKVAWPTKQEIVSSVWIVVISLFIFAFFVFLVDTILRQLLKVLLY